MPKKSRKGITGRRLIEKFRAKSTKASMANSLDQKLVEWKRIEVE